MKIVRTRVVQQLIESLESRTLLSASPFDLIGVSKALSGTPIITVSRPMRALTGITENIGGKPTQSNGKPTAPTDTVATPANVAATALSLTQVKVTWTPNTPGATGYYLYRSTNNVSFSKIATINNASIGSYTDNGLSAGTTYYYYVVAYKKSTLSANSNLASVATPIPAPVVAPTAPTNLAIAGTTSNSISLTWTDVATNASGYYVYRSADGITYTRVASLGANSHAYTDSGLASGTQYDYEVFAWNSGGENDTAAISASTVSVIPSGTPINIFTRYGGELVLAGTSGNDSIYVSQSGSTLTITSNGTTITDAVPSYGLFIYSDGGTDTITVNSSVTVRTTVATIDGSATAISDGDANSSVWMDSTDSFSGLGSVHSVAGFYGGVSKAIGINIAEPTDIGATYTASASLWGAGPVMGDVNQGNVGDCYFVSSLAAFANNAPANLQNLAVDLGDGTYAVEYLRGGTPTYVRVDGQITTAYAHPGASGDLWAVIMEKSYAYFRTGANSYASLNSGWMGSVYSDFGIANTNLSLSTTATSFYNTVATALATGKPVTFGTYNSPPNLVGNHAYTLVSVSNTGGQMLFTVRNPWGVSGDALEDGGGYATLTFAQMQANFTLGTMAT